MIKGMRRWGILFSFIFFFFSFKGFSQSNEWSVTLQPALNGVNQSLVLKIGMKQGATDNFDQGIDELAPPASPDGDTYYFSSITGEPSPKDKLLLDYRNVSSTQTTWRMVLKVAPGKTMVISWSPSEFPSNWTFTYQTANASWQGTGSPVNMATSTQITVENTEDETITKRYLIVASFTPPTTYTISGKVTLQGGSALVSDVVLTLSGATSQTTHPDSNGNYSFTGLPEGNYTITPSLANYTFTPGSRSYSPLNSNQTGQDFTGIYQCTLTVNSAHDNPNPSGTRTYDYGTQITASVTSPADETNGTRYVCTGWTGTGSVPSTGTTNSVRFTITQDSTITWNWKTQYLLSYSVTPSGSGTITVNPTATGNWYDEGASVTLRAIPSSNEWIFDHWEGDISGKTNPTTITMNSPKNVIAVFVRNAPELSVNPTSFEFVFNIGNTSEPEWKSDEITIKNTGVAGENLRWQVGNIVYKEGNGWIDEPQVGESGELSPGEDTKITIKVKRTGLASGIYHAIVPILSDNAINTKRIDINVTMKIDTPPTAAVIYPFDQSVKVETFLTLEAEFTDPDEGDKIIESTWEIYQGESGQIDERIFQKKISGSQNTLSLPWSLFSKKQGENKYWWRVKCKDLFGGLESEWANSGTFTIVEDDTFKNQQFEQEQKENILESFGNAGIEANTAFKDAVNGETIVAGVSNGYLEIRSIDPANVKGSEAFNIKYLFDIRVSGIDEDSEVTLSLYLPGNYTGKWYKYNSVDNAWNIYPNAEIAGTVVVDGQTYTRINITLKDGEYGDFDNKVNGVIVDPSGLGVSLPSPGVSSVSGGGGCFIATACFGNYNHPFVRILREFRDRFLLKNKIGKAFVRWYYIHSPRYAEIISRSVILKGIVRFSLIPFVIFAYLCIKGLLLPLILISLLTFLLRKKSIGKVLPVLIFLFFFSSNLFAQDINLVKLLPGEKYTVSTPTRFILEKGKLQIDFVYSYADKVLEGIVGGVKRDIIKSQNLLQLGLTYGLTDKFNISVLVPYLIDQDVLQGQNYDDSGLGDIYLIGKYKIWDGGRECYGVVILPFIGFETGDEDALIGADSMVYGLKISIDKYLTDKLIGAINLGYSHQSKVTLGQIDIENTFLYGASLIYIVNDKLSFSGELIGRSDDGFFKEREKYPLEGIISLNYNFKNAQFLIGGGTGIIDGYSASRWRAFTGIKKAF